MFVWSFVIICAASFSIGLCNAAIVVAHNATTPIQHREFTMKLPRFCFQFESYKSSKLR